MISSKGTHSGGEFTPLQRPLHIELFAEAGEIGWMQVQKLGGFSAVASGLFHCPFEDFLFRRGHFGFPAAEVRRFGGTGDVVRQVFPAYKRRLAEGDGAQDGMLQFPDVSRPGV